MTLQEKKTKSPMNIEAKILNKMLTRDFSGGTVDKNLPASAGDTGLIPGPGESHTPRSNYGHALQLLSLSTYSLCFTTRETTALRSLHTTTKGNPCSSQLEKAHARSNGDPVQ